MTTMKTKASRLFSKLTGRDNLHDHAVKHDKLDAGVLRDWKEQASKLAEQYQNPPFETDPKAWGDMLDDSFYAHFGDEDPTVRSQNEMKKSRLVNQQVAEKLARSQDLAETRVGTRNRPMESALATMAGAESLRESYQGELAEHVDRQNDISDAEQRVQDLDKAMEDIRASEQAGDSPEEHQANVDYSRELGQAKRKALQELRALEAAQDAAAVELDAATSQAARKAASAAQEATEAAQNIPGVGIGKSPGAGATLSPDAMFELAQRYAESRRLQNIIELLGRLLPDMKHIRRTQRKGGYEEIVDIETGNDLPSVLPSELMRLAHPAMKRDFLRRFAEAQLLQYERWSSEDRKKGPVIVVIDESSSMNGARIEWAKATALAVVLMANREGRNAAVVAFGSHGQVEEWQFPKGKSPDPVELTNCAEHFFAGGTSIQTGVGRAAAIMNLSAPFATADLIIVTDGEDTWGEGDELLRNTLVAEGTQIHGVTIHSHPTNYMLNMCSQTTPVWELDGKNEATDRLASHIS